MFKLSVIIGRFSGLHAGHEFLIETAISRGDVVLILLGSANRPRTVKNPWTWQERAKAIQGKFPEVGVLPLNDYKYNDEQWISDVNFTVESALQGKEAQITLFGHEKPDTDYLAWFPNWRYFQVESDILGSGTITRDHLYRISPTVYTPEVQSDFKYFEEELTTFTDYPYPSALNINCADAVVECAGHILLIKRKASPGKNTWALPGGHKESNETFIDCAFRELTEETNLRVPEKVLRGSVRATKLFDSPTRGCGIPKTTLAVYIKIEKDRDGNMPRVSPSDDAIQAEWVKINEVMNSRKLHDDHQDIISDMTGALPVPAVLNPDN